MSYIFSITHLHRLIANFSYGQFFNQIKYFYYGFGPKDEDKKRGDKCPNLLPGPDFVFSGPQKGLLGGVI